MQTFVLMTKLPPELSSKVKQREQMGRNWLDQVKTKLFTNITHEFRTPLTVILGMAEQVVQTPEKWFREGMEMITRNGRRLLELGVIEYVEEDMAYEPIIGTYPMAQAQAFFNWIGLVEDRSMGVHNPSYVEALIDNSIEAIAP